MRVAVLADIHGNLPAFEAVLDHIAQQRIDQIIIAGDIVNGAPDSDKCWELACSLNCPMVRGNHERYVFDYGTPNADPNWAGERFSPIHWAVSQFSKNDIQAMADLPLALSLSELPDLFITHASPRSDQDSLKGHMPDHVLAEMFGNVQEKTIVRGHNHLVYTNQWQGKQIITVGSVGLSMDGLTAARYSILERIDNRWHNIPQAIPYDVDLTIRRFHESGYLEATHPMGRLYLREVATATYGFVPFLRHYFRWQEEDPNGLGALSLAESIDHFLNLY